MSHIDGTRKSYSSPYEITVCMTKEECKILLPFFQKAYKSVKSKYEKYNDIHNGGEATEREENLLMKYSEQLERLESVLSSIDEILKWTDMSKKRTMQIDVIEEVKGTQFMQCKLYIDGNASVILMNKIDYERLLSDSFFVRDGKNRDSAGVLNTTNTFLEKD